jgi:hypothetical protein
MIVRCIHTYIHIWGHCYSQILRFDCKSEFRIMSMIVRYMHTYIHAGALLLLVTLLYIHTHTYIHTYMVALLLLVTLLLYIHIHTYPHVLVYKQIHMHIYKGSCWRNIIATSHQYIYTCGHPFIHIHARTYTHVADHQYPL